MRPILCRLVVILSCTALLACTSMRTVVDRTAMPDSAPTSPGASLVSNDALTVTTRDGAKTQIHLTSATSEFIEGKQDSDQLARKFLLSDVDKVERREIDGVKTTFFVVLIVAGLYALAYAAASATLAGNL
jgi:hypothetical protein